MCRLLYVRSKSEFNITDYLQHFAAIAKNSKEFQGHGWGCSFLRGDKWQHYKNIKPIWEDDLEQFTSANLLLAHARSAFRDKDIFVENNMPFYDEKYVFIFNGELRGVKIKAEGRIGAEKIFNFIKRFDKGNILSAMKTGTDIIKKRSDYIRAMNFIIADKSNAFVNSYFSEDPRYFTLMKLKTDDATIVCSEQLAIEGCWEKINNNYLGEI